MDEKTVKDAPQRVVPYIVPSELNQSLLLIRGPFTLVGAQEGILDADLRFRWFPSIAVEFEGVFSKSYLEIEDQWWLVAEGDTAFRTPVHIANATITLGSKSSRVSGFLQESLNLGDSSFEVLRFSLANFPDYDGTPVRYESERASGFFNSRLHLASAQGICQLDVLPETSELRKRARKDAGFVISHVGQWLPSNGKMTVQDAEEVLELLRVWFGFLRGTWAGPLFPQGLSAGNVVWRQFAAWRLNESQFTPTWLPEQQRLDIANAFSGFARLWSDQAWRDPLKLAVSSFVEANGRGMSPESKIVLAQVALELLAWVHLVETQNLYSRKKFNDLRAAGRIRELLVQSAIPTAIPDYLTTLATICHGSPADGPSVITSVRNHLVHSTDNSRAAIKDLSSMQLFECS